MSTENSNYQDARCTYKMKMYVQDASAVFQPQRGDHIAKHAREVMRINWYGLAGIYCICEGGSK